MYAPHERLQNSLSAGQRGAQVRVLSQSLDRQSIRLLTFATGPLDLGLDAACSCYPKLQGARKSATVPQSCSALTTSRDRLVAALVTKLFRRTEASCLEVRRPSPPPRPFIAANNLSGYSTSTPATQSIFNIQQRAYSTSHFRQRDLSFRSGTPKVAPAQPLLFRPPTLSFVTDELLMLLQPQ